MYFGFMALKQTIQEKHFVLQTFGHEFVFVVWLTDFNQSMSLQFIAKTEESEEEKENGRKRKEEKVRKNGNNQA